MSLEERQENRLVETWLAAKLQDHRDAEEEAKRVADRSTDKEAGEIEEDEVPLEGDREGESKALVKVVKEDERSILRRDKARQRPPQQQETKVGHNGRNCTLHQPWR